MVSEKKIYFSFSHFKSMGANDPLGHGQFGPQGLDWQDLYRGPLNIATYYGKCPKILNTLKFRTPNIFPQNNFWKCPKISNSSSFAKRGFLKFRTQLASSNVLSAHSNFGNLFFRYGTGN